MGRDRITRSGARAPGAEYNPTPWRLTKESSARHSTGQPTLTPWCAKDGGKPDSDRRMPGAGLSRRCTGQTLSDMPAFQPYWGKPAVRNDREDGGNVGIIRSPLRATVLPDCGGVRSNPYPYRDSPTPGAEGTALHSSPYSRIKPSHSARTAGVSQARRNSSRTAFHSFSENVKVIPLLRARKENSTSFPCSPT